MKVLSESEVLDSWISRDPERVQRDRSGYYFNYPEASCIALEYPAKLERLPYFARYLSTLKYAENELAGMLLWHMDWGRWNNYEESIGYRTVEKFAIAAGQPCSFEAKSGFLFRADESAEAVAMLLQPMIFGWDAYYLPWFNYGVEEFFLRISHDSYVLIVTRTKGFYEETFANLESLNFNPKRAPEHIAARFCRTAAV